MTPEATLELIRTRLAATDPIDLAIELTPTTRTEAVPWTRRLAHWDEFRGRFPDQAVAVARVISTRAMRRFDLAIDAAGRVRDDKPRRSFATPDPALTFPLDAAGATVTVEYTPDYFPHAGQDHFAFVGPHPVCPGGYRSQFAPRDAVEACGGPEAYAARFAAARLRGAEQEFDAAFTGHPPTARPVPATKAVPPPPEQAAQKPQPQTNALPTAPTGRFQDRVKPNTQRTLFDGPG